MLCIDCNYFQSRGRIFKQVQGTPMGSPISPVFAEFALQLFEDNCVNGNPDVKFYFRYVDDTFIVHPAGKSEALLAKFNSFNKNLQFTYEAEVNFQIPFLDVLIIRNPDNGRISRTVNRKSTHTGLYLNYHSFHHHSQKISVIDSLLFRALYVSDDENINSELNFVEEMLIKNGYPVSLVKKRIPRMRERIKNLNSTDNSNKKSETRIILPYVGQATNRLTKCIRSKISCEFGYTPGTRMKKIVCNQKDKIALCNGTGIYKIMCSCNSVYIGETVRTYK